MLGILSCIKDCYVHAEHASLSGGKVALYLYEMEETIFKGKYKIHFNKL